MCLWQNGLPFLSRSYNHRRSVESQLYVFFSSFLVDFFYILNEMHNKSRAALFAQAILSQILRVSKNRLGHPLQRRQCP